MNTKPVEVQGSKAFCYLDGKLIQTAKLTPPQPQAGLYALGGKDKKSGQIILKAVNPGPLPLDTTVRIAGTAMLKPKARVITLAGDQPSDQNTLEDPTKVVPVESTFDGVAAEINYTLKPYLLTILRIDTSG